MKSMTCRDLGGACDLVFQAETFEEIAAMSKAHGTEMFAKKDAEHLEAMQAMRELMKTPQAMKEWFMGRKAAFEALPDE